MNRVLILGLSIFALAAWHANAAFDADYTVYSGGGYNSDGTPALGSSVGSGLTPWLPAGFDAIFLAASPGHTEMSNWLPLGYQSFSAKVTGSFVAPSSGYYDFCINSAGASALYIDGTLAINHGWAHAPRYKGSPIFLAAGAHFLASTLYIDSPNSLTASLVPYTYSVYIDKRLSPVPEPSTYVAGLGALVMLCLFGWRNRK